MSRTIRDVVFVGFSDVELLDLAGPFEVLTTAVQLLGDEGPRCVVAAPEVGPFRSRNGLGLSADVSLVDVDAVDLLVIPGGRGVRDVLTDRPALDTLATLVDRAALTLSVCTGSLILAELGLLDGVRATTHHLALADLEAAAPKAEVVTDRRWIESERLVISAGVASGIDAAFHVVERLWGGELAGECARHIEYPWTPGDAG